MPIALVSVSDKTGLEQFARELATNYGYTFVATTSTARHLNDAGIECRTVKELTRFPEILGGRVKTLHPHIFAGILARDNRDDRESLEELQIEAIDMVVANLYPFEEKLNAHLDESSMIEEIDIGGVTLLRAAAKNFYRVTIASDPGQYDAILEELKSNKGAATREFKKSLAVRAFKRTRAYDAAIGSYLESSCEESEACNKSLPASLNLRLEQYQPLRYGENPHQAATWYSNPVANGNRGDFPPFEQLQGKELSSNNIVDTFALVSILRDLERPATCIIKHNNPCGVALGDNLKDSFEKALSTDPVSAFGGIFGFTETLDIDVVEEMLKGFVEIVAAPDFTDDALKRLKKKKNVRVLRLKPSVMTSEGKEIWKARDLKDFGWILEKAEVPPVQADSFETVAGQVDNSLQRDIRFAWSVVRHLTSNAIFLAKGGRSLGFGIGQTSRIASVKIAIEQAGKEAGGSVMASDAFFPATDNIEAAAAAGIKVIVQPGGSIKDKDVIEACKEQGIAMLLTGQRCFKH